MTQPRWLWPKSSVTRVIDGDSFVARVTRDIGFHGTTTFEVKLRLNRINAPARTTERGADARDAATRYLTGPSVIAAWLHHQHHNPHHWQHWVLREDDGDLMALPMPEHFAREMAITGSWDVSEWYAKHTEIMVLHPDTRVLVEELLARRA